MLCKFLIVIMLEAYSAVVDINKNLLPCLRRIATDKYQYFYDECLYKIINEGPDSCIPALFHPDEKTDNNKTTAILNG